MSKPRTYAEGGRIGGRKRWANVPPEERSRLLKRARAAAEIKKRRRLRAVRALLWAIDEAVSIPKTVAEAAAKVRQEYGIPHDCRFLEDLDD
ncbi:MAG: hypothetical protein KatS3mg082_1420 [Nitrospiraceae bacterium]|nr:MAG: hypothetical protein KatS3mg082_1420 [Nitrospiraceae bacterium]